MSAKNGSLPLGLSLGLILPVIAFVIFYYSVMDKFSDFDTFWRYVKTTNVRMQLSVICILPNIILFYIFTNKRFIRTAQGIFVPTLLLVIAIVALFA